MQGRASRTSQLGTVSLLGVGRETAKDPPGNLGSRKQKDMEMCWPLSIFILCSPSSLPALGVSQWVDPTTQPVPWSHSLGLVLLGLCSCWRGGQGGEEEEATRS